MAQTVVMDDALGTDHYSVGLDELGRIRISPTDVSQFIRRYHGRPRPMALDCP